MQVGISGAFAADSLYCLRFFLVWGGSGKSLVLGLVFLPTASWAPGPNASAPCVTQPLPNSIGKTVNRITNRSWRHGLADGGDVRDPNKHIRRRVLSVAWFGADA
jgi:hypothetical protein